jgi:hypothetical protein
MTMPWDMSFTISEPASRIVEDASLVDYVEDWSKVRSPSRARRRLKRGIRKSLPMKAVPNKTVYSIDNGRVLVMHPEVARAMERQLTAQIDRMTEQATILTGRV